MRVISVRGDGANPSDLFVDEAPRPETGPGSVLIRISHAGVNRPDILQRRGLYPPPTGAAPGLGLEVSGWIEAINPALPPPSSSEGVGRLKLSDGLGWRVGDAVCALVNGGGYAEYVSVDLRHLLPIPAGWSMAQAASLPEAALTVYANLIEHGGLQAGETVLVHGGNSGIGAMTIQLGKAWGAQVIATARGADKCAFASSLGADLVIDTAADEDFVAAVKTAGGADVVLDIVAGDYVPRNLLCLNMKGRMVQVGMGRSPVVELDLRRVMQKQAVITGSMLRPRSADEKARLTAKVHEKMWPLIEAGAIKPVLAEVFAFEDAGKAHTWMEESHCGKVVMQA
ncbi:NAD(P)H-quinone oxidoreductase [Asticcacaulis sp. AC402]|uniref:NAD(P)H-quinone oxidoreductase n=1 Tax=Asticcacaulis sp. AC402 TaxID=1282361 RepID=UPI0003C3CC20|nr:NAD(P)H-quinone oxidoreductase [Asticcacaulis sp. AC402]ESQ74555.1 NAD(P)H quinone oxidoreductase [Asticcacaulis sp. AC402]